jgi:photosystem II stability/assembly factor-like uncharacterized protein
VIVEQANKPQGIWYQDPKDPDQIQGPTKSPKTTPCNDQHVLGLASLSSSEAMVVCTDGSAMVKSDAGKSWKRVDEVPGTVAVGAGGGRFWIAGIDENCDGVAIRALKLASGRLSPGRSRCAADLPATPGEVAIDASGKAIWLWAGAKVQVSTDGGRSWN